MNITLEIQGYKMKRDHEGARLTEIDEVPDFYDLSVLEYHHDSGEIIPIEEIEDIESFEKADIMMGQLIDKYPAADDCGGWVN